MMRVDGYFEVSIDKAHKWKNSEPVLELENGGLATEGTFQRSKVPLPSLQLSPENIRKALGLEAPCTPEGKSNEKVVLDGKPVSHSTPCSWAPSSFLMRCRWK